MESEGQWPQHFQMPNNYTPISHNYIYFLNIKIILVNAENSYLFFLENSNNELSQMQQQLIG
jgi:hypothetical protein